VVDRGLPFAPVLVDDAELSLFASDGGAIVDAIVADDPAALRWGQGVYERHRERSIPA
jgi:predicted transcriptional regulator